jgi:hypothetical protein
MNTSTDFSQAPHQLALLEDIPLPLQFRLDARTRERGLAHVAAIRAQLAARAADRPPTEADTTTRRHAA